MKPLTLMAATLGTFLALRFAGAEMVQVDPSPVHWTCSMAVCFAYHDDGVVFAIKKYGEIKLGVRP